MDASSCMHAADRQMGPCCDLLPLLRPEIAIKSGDIVGVFGGYATHCTEGAEQLMVACDGPADDGLEDCVAVAFVGQVQVNVEGPVKPGDFIVPSGRADGVGVPVSKKGLVRGDWEQVVARSWQRADELRVHKIRAVVGLPPQQAAQRATVALLRHRISVLEGQAAVQRELIEGLQAQRSRVSQLVRLVHEQIGQQSQAACEQLLPKIDSAQE